MLVQLRSVCMTAVCANVSLICWFCCVAVCAHLMLLRLLCYSRHSRCCTSCALVVVIALIIRLINCCLLVLKSCHTHRNAAQQFKLQLLQACLFDVTMSLKHFLTIFSISFSSSQISFRALSLSLVFDLRFFLFDLNQKYTI